MLSFKFGDKDSYKDFGVYVINRPTVTSPKRKVDYVDVPGRSGTLKYDSNAYEDITISVECGIVNRGDTSGIYYNIEDIKAWLFGVGESTLVFSYMGDRYYLAQVVNQLDFNISYKRVGEFVIVFNCKPFQFAFDNSKITIENNNTNIINAGSVCSKPIIEVFGSRDINLSVNEKNIQLFKISNKIILNSEIQDAYDNDFKNLNSKVLGSFLDFEVGNNIIKWEGNVTKLRITPNWRWL